MPSQLDKFLEHDKLIREGQQRALEGLYRLDKSGGYKALGYSSINEVIREQVHKHFTEFDDDFKEFMIETQVEALKKYKLYKKLAIQSLN